MSTATQRTGEGANQMTVDYSRRKLLLFGAADSQRTEVLKNTSGDVLDLQEGRILARISTAADQGKLVVLEPAATNGREIPVGVYFGSARSVAAGAEANVNVVVSGEINEAVVADSATGNPDLDTTIIAKRSLRDQLQAQTAGLKLVASTSLTSIDN